jgi:hypothetical protein
MLNNLMESGFRWNPLVVRGEDDDLQLERCISEDDIIDAVVESFNRDGDPHSRKEVVRDVRRFKEAVLRILKEGGTFVMFPGLLKILPTITPDGYYECYSPDPKVKENFERSLLRLWFKAE